MRDASPFPGQPPQRPWDQVCWPQAMERHRGTEDMRGQILTGLDGVACFMPKSDQKAPGFVHDKGQRGRHTMSQQQRKGELLTGFRPSSKPASKRQGQQEGTVLGPGHSKDITHSSEQTHTHRHFHVQFQGAAQTPQSPPSILGVRCLKFCLLFCHLPRLSFPPCKMGIWTPTSFPC